MKRFLVGALATATLALSTPALAQTDRGVVASILGQVSTQKQQDRVAFEVTPEKFGLTGDGRIGLVFVLSAEGGSLLDPGLIVVTANGGTVEVGGTRRPDTAGSKSSIALATLAAGTYDIWVRGEKKTTGAYRLDVLLAGDANGDLRIDDADILLIGQLSPVRVGETDYSALADVDRNGVINGGDRQRALANFGGSAQVALAVNPLDQPLPPGALTLNEGSTTTFNRRSGPLQFSLIGAEFSLDPTEVVLTINGVSVPEGNLTITEHLLSSNLPLYDGKNDVSLKAYDTIGRPLYFNGTLWAGAATLRVNLVNPNGTPFLQEATIVVALSDDPSVVARITTSAGTALFPNMPARTVLVKALGIGNETGSAGVIGTQGTVQVTMLGFGAPSPIANNDFSQGTLGWNIGSAPVFIVPHQETIPGFPASAQPTALAALSTLAAAAIVDDDLLLSTGGLGERAISRSFTTQAGTTGVRIRYRFITTEVPGGYFGSQFNDYFRVSLRSQQGGGAQIEQNSMNSLGLGAFDFASGSTNWREFTLQVDRAGDTIQADIAVANVGDGLFPSYVVVDFVEEIRDEVRPQLSWNNTAGGLNLTFEVLRDLTQAVVIDVHWASGAAYGDRIGAALFSYTVPSGTVAGTYGPVHVAGNLLAADPANVTHLLAASSPTMIGAVPDVRLTYGANANQAVVSAAMVDVIRDGQRAAGQSLATITSTSRTPADQARAMFQNLTNPSHTIAENVQNQLTLYGAAGDRVINVFVAQTTDMARDQILANGAAIRAAMAADITANIQAWSQTGHLADPNVLVVVDVWATVFNAQNGPLFVGSVQPRLTRFFDERATNSCYHLELAR